MIPRTFIVLFLWIVPWFPATSDDFDDIEVYDVNEPRSRLLMVDGHMWFHAGKGKNMTFKTSGGGSIFIDQTDISRLPDIADFRNLKEKVEMMNSRSDTIVSRLDSCQRSVFLVASISKRLMLMSRNLTTDIGILKEYRQNRTLKDVRFRKFMGRLQKNIKSLVDMLATDGCADKPCLNGGTCIARFGKKYNCICPTHKTGDNCDMDINECEIYKGTHAGCQNNASCIDIDGGFICNCTSGYHGPLCEYKQSTCSRTIELCGQHGHCLDVDNPNNEVQYKCLCEWGYKLSDDNQNPTCVDINECLLSPCHPGVDCINLPGTFQCAGCPKGYHGNGQLCVDVDECAADVYPCSLNPRVPCFNTLGSFQCGSCPAGYRGNGRTCRKDSACDGSPCHPIAQCIEYENSMYPGGFVCHCPAGTMGDGIGENGCVKNNSTICLLEGRCMNGGTCKPLSNSEYRCACAEFYYGDRCEKVSLCISSPCKNGGNCEDTGDGTMTCNCPPGFFGSYCQVEENSCGAHITSPTGNFTFPDEAGTPAEEGCEIVITPNGANMVLLITFVQFSDMSNTEAGSTDCTRTAGNLTLFDGPGDNSPVFSTFCGEASSPKAPIINEPITMTTSDAMLKFKGTKGSFTINWELKKRDCGYRTNLPEGSLLVPMHHLDTSCEWFISAPFDKFIEIDIPSVEMTSGDQLNCTINQLEIFDGYTSYDAHRVVHICETTTVITKVRSTGPFLSVAFSSNIFGGMKSPLHKGFTMKYRIVEPDRKCGGHITNVRKDWEFSGVIESPNWGGFYPPNMDCTWMIDGVDSLNGTTTGQTLKLEFYTFDVPSPFQFALENRIRLLEHVRALQDRWLLKDTTISSNMNKDSLPLRRRVPAFPFRRNLMYKCSQDYLHVFSDGDLVHDGCNTHPPPTSLLLSTPQTILRFHSDSSNQGKGFRVGFSMVCEKTLRGNGTIQTWNYPSGGRAGKCRYIIKAEPTQAIRIKFKTIGLRVASTSQCFFNRDNLLESADYMEFTGGRPDDKQLNQRYICARYPFVEEGEFIMSGNRPLIIEYASSGHPNNKGILLEFLTMDVGCGGVFSQSSSIISSPNYPDKYLAHMHCVYQIQVPWSKQIRLTFDNFELEVVTNDECSYDNVAVYERYVSENDHGKLLGRFCGGLIPPPLLSTSYKMVVVFNSDRSVAGKGFSARFEAVDSSIDCDRTFTAPSGEIVFNGSLGRFAQCDFHISVISTARILLKMNNMSIPCTRSKLQIRNGISEQSPGFPTLRGDSEVCDEYPMDVLRSHGSRVLITLRTTDSSKTFFIMSYEQVISSCGGHMEGVSGSIAAPQYPLKDSRSLDCSWTIAVAHGNRVRFSLVNLDDLKSSDDSGFCGLFASNRLDIFDGPHNDARLMRRYCKKEVGSEPLTSDDNEMAVKYKQHGGMMFGALYGFMAHFSTVCTDIILTDFTGSIQSPGFPNNVWTSRYCTWTIKVPSGNRIQINFHHFLIEKKFRWGVQRAKCMENWLKFGEGEIAEATVKNGYFINVTNELTETCNDMAQPIHIKSNNNTLHITFQSKNQEQNHFWLTWRTIGCGGDFLTPAAISTNINKMDMSANKLECQWRIMAPIGKRVELRIDTFSLFQIAGSDCEYTEDEDKFNGIAVFAGRSNISGFPQNIICSSVKNITYRSHTNEMFIKLKVTSKSVMADASGYFFNANIGFVEPNISDRDDCGGIVEVSPSQLSAIHSPRYPEEYPRGSECEWLLKAPAGYYLIYTIKDYRTPNAHPQKSERRWTPTKMDNLTCQHPLPMIEGALTIYGGKDRNSEKLERICIDIDRSIDVPTLARESLVTFQGASTHRNHMSGEDQHKKKIGFLLEARTGCGGLVLAEDHEQVMAFSDLDEKICNITIRKKNNDDSGIYLRIDELTNRGISKKYRGDMVAMVQGNSYIDIQLDSGQVTTREVKGPYLGGLGTTHEEFRAKSEIRLGFVRRNALLVTRISLAYSTITTRCGGEINARDGLIGNPDIIDDFDCVWTIRENPGNLVRVSVSSLKLPYSFNCTDSYLEFRKWNASGPLLGRWCEKQSPIFAFVEVIWIKFRYVKPTSDDLNNDPNDKPLMGIMFSRLHGGLTTSHIIEQPRVMFDEFFSSYNWAVNGDQDKDILVHIESISIPEENINNFGTKVGLYLSETSDSPSGFLDARRAGGIRLAGFLPPEDIYLPYSRFDVSLFAPPGSKFRLSWQSIPKRNLNSTVLSENIKTKEYACGSELIPSWEWQEIHNPTIPGKNSGYLPHQHCKWIIERPMLTGLQFKIVMLDLEDAVGCPFDFVAVIADRDRAETDGDDISTGQKFCRNTQVNRTFDYTYNKVLYIHFVSDRSREGQGFVIMYRLTCNSFDYIKSSYGLFNHILTSPQYPNSRINEKCSWSVVLQSNRRILIEILDLDIEYTQDCTNDALVVSPRSLQIETHSKFQSRYCGKLNNLEKANQTLPVGRLFIKYSNTFTEKKGFKLYITEISEECNSEHLYVDENEMSKLFTTPHYPAMIPHSLDCRYTLRAPNGHRLKFTVNSENFRLESSGDECGCDDCDWLEIRDGPTEHSALIGLYCNNFAPSTIFSTGNFLFIRIRTDVFAASSGFSAIYELASCGGTVVLRPEQKYMLTSPNYPDAYPSQTDCEWMVRTPNSHMVEARLNHMWLSWNVNCTLDSLALRDGNSTDPYLLTPQCNGRALPKLDYRSSSSSMTVQFHANNTIQRGGRQFCKDKKCGFEIELRVSNQSCGGLISGERGTLTTPGYPNRLIPYVQCTWEMRAEIGYRYLLEFEFLEKNGFYQKRYDGEQLSGCFSDLMYHNGKPSHSSINFRNERMFCDKKSTFISEADLVTLIYSDTHTRHHKEMGDDLNEDMYYVPFRVNYTKVPAQIDDKGCGVLITQNETHSFKFSNITTEDGARYCHVIIRRPAGYSTTVLSIKDYNEFDVVKSLDCNDWSSSIILESTDDTPRTVQERFCSASFMNQTKPITKMFLNEELQMHIFTFTSTFPLELGHSFTLDVKFQKCGGVITEPDNGVLSNLNFGEERLYLPNSSCQWLLQAPEGKIAKVTITDMDIEYNNACLADVLVIGEGVNNNVIHRYCNREQRNGSEAQDEILQERFKIIKSHSRYLTITWTTDTSNEFRGWRLEYEFINENSECGFSINAMSGVIHSPNWPNDYKNDEQCIWDIQVPLGYHVQIKFTHFDIEPSEQCINDALIISQEHSSRAFAPIGDYYFLFQDEEAHPPMCGIVVPKDIRSESNRVRLNFTSNEKTTAAGFRAEWTAECGTVFRLSHGVISSPHYPEFYPNNNSKCEYLIDPVNANQNTVIILKLIDFDLSEIKYDYSRSPCTGDNIEIKDVTNNRVVVVYCGGDPKNDQPILIKGAVGITFTTNHSFVYQRKKMNRGFQISYAISKCGGQVELSAEHGYMDSISSPAFPLDYAHDLDCSWNVSAPKERIISIKYEVLDLEASADCSLDFLEVFDGDIISNKTSMGKLCGDNSRMPQGRIFTKSNRILIHFVSDRSMSKGGFKMIITATLGPQSGCGGLLTAKADWQTLKPPLNDDGQYIHNLHCGWNIIGAEKTMLELKILKIDTEDLQQLPGARTASRCVDAITIYDGYKSFSPVLATDICEDPTITYPLVYHTSHRVAHFYFESDVSGSGSGFVMQYRTIKPDCGDWLTATNDIQTYVYDSKNDSDRHVGQTNQRCQWVIQSKSQTPILLKFSTLKFPSLDGDCSDAFVDIRDVGLISKCKHPACANQNSDRKVYRICGSTSVAPFISNTMAVQITTSAIINDYDGARFIMSYMLLDSCNRTIDAMLNPSGRLTSPNFPNPYDHNSTCTTDIQAPIDRRILIVFRSFDIERGRITFFRINRTGTYSETVRNYRRIFRQSCDFDFLNIIEPGRNSSGKICGKGLPQTWFTWGNVLELYLQTDFNMATAGYDLSYFTGRLLTENTIDFSPTYDAIGAITNIGFPKGYNASTKSSWTMMPPNGQACKIDITVLSIGKRVDEMDCINQDEYLEIEQSTGKPIHPHGGKDTIRIRSCSHNVPLTMEMDPGSNRYVKITFKSDERSDNDGSGFRLSWECANYELIH